MERVSAFFVPVITLLIAQFTAISLGSLRFHGKKLFILLGLELLFQVLLNAPIILIFGLSVYARWYVLTMDLPAIILFFYLSERRDPSTLYTILCTIFTGISISFVAMWVVNIFGRGYNQYNITRVILFILVMPIIHNILRKKYQIVQREMERGWGIFCILPIIGIAALYYQYYRYDFVYNDFSTLIYSSFVILVIMVVLLVLFYLINQLHEKNLLQEQQRILTLQNKAQWEMFEYQKEAAEKSNRRWHDYRFHTNNLIELLESGDTDSAIQYLKEQQMYDLSTKEEYCLHTAVNSILSLWEERSKKAGILIDIKTEIPEILNIDSTELSVLFANALENAYYGCVYLEAGNEKYIQVQSYYSSDRLTVSITNSCQDSIRFQDGLPLSMKKGGGLGTRSILNTVERHQGMAFFEAKDQRFTFRAVLNV